MAKLPYQTMLTQSLSSHEDLNAAGLLRDGLNQMPDFDVRLNPYLHSLIDPSDPNDPIARQYVPARAENVRLPGEVDDAEGEEDDTVAGVLIHKYPNRVLLYSSNTCGSLCRFCTRKRKISKPLGLQKAKYEAAFAYLREHPEIEDVLMSGADILVTGNAWIEYLLSNLRQIPSVKVIRLGTRTLSQLPQRILEDDALLDILRTHDVRYISTHFNHPRELSPVARAAITKMLDRGFTIGNQTVLLKGVNDDLETMRTLQTELYYAGVRPYYIYHCDLTYGNGHFRTTIARGRWLMENLRGHVSGYAVPTYVFDGPEGLGKVPINPDYVSHIVSDGLVVPLGDVRNDFPEALDMPRVYLLRNYAGKTFVYDERTVLPQE